MSYADVLVACMSITLASAAVSMTLSNKEALASRIYVWLCTIIQSLSFLSLVIALAKWKTAMSGSTTCTRQIWWGVVDSRSHSPVLLWFYIMIRIGISAHTSCIWL